MEITEFVDKIEDLVYQLTPGIDSLEDVMVLISNELRRRYATTAPNTEYIQDLGDIEIADGLDN